VIFVSLFLFPFWFLSSFGIVTSYSWDSFLRFKGNTYFLSGVAALVFCESSWVLSTLESKSNSFDMFSCSSIKCVILLVMKYFNSSFFFSKTYSSFLLVWSFSI
jgi:hypothetical protein